MIVNLTKEEIIQLLINSVSTPSLDFISKHSMLVSEDGWGRILWNRKILNELTDEYLWKLYCELDKRCEL